MFIIHLLPHCPSIHIYEIKSQPKNHHSYFYDSLFFAYCMFFCSNMYCSSYPLVLHHHRKKKLKELFNKAWGQNINHSLTFCNAHFFASKMIQQQYPIQNTRCTMCIFNVQFSLNHIFILLCMFNIM